MELFKYKGKYGKDIKRPNNTFGKRDVTERYTKYLRKLFHCHRR